MSVELGKALLKEYIEQVKFTQDRWNYATHVENIQNVGLTNLLLGNFLQLHNNDLFRILDNMCQQMLQLESENELIREKIKHLESVNGEFKYD